VNLCHVDLSLCSLQQLKTESLFNCIKVIKVSEVVLCSHIINPRLTSGGGGWLSPPLFLRNNFFAMRNFEIRFREPIKHSFAHLLVKNVENGLFDSKAISG
jgi:hypothetical protein